VFKHIFVPTDGSDLSRRSAAAAVDFARESGARITTFFARPEFPVTYYGEGGIKDPATPERFAALAEKQASGYLSEIERLCADAGVSCSLVSVSSEVPHEAIIEAAERAGCDLIFMASHGRRGLSAFLLGSVTNKVLTFSKIPVLVWR
jgi:nucleotide-binding universal stress UspA family protein